MMSFFPRMARPIVWRTLGVAIIAYAFALFAAVNALWFVLRASSPVIWSDAWYFLDVFLSKAINGTLEFSDFFVKRMSSDHSQPLSKVVLWIEWRYFDLDFVVEAVVGVLAAVACATIFHWLVMAGKRGKRPDVGRLLAWAAMCALLFTLNTNGGTWTWTLVALGNLSFVPILLFLVAVWHAFKSGRYILLAIATLLFGLVSDDSAIITVVAVAITLGLVAIHESTQGRRAIAKTMGTIVVCLVLTRMGYSFAPIVGGSEGPSLSSLAVALLQKFSEGGWWKWIVIPMVMPVAYDDPFHYVAGPGWTAVQVTLALLLLVAHGAFWWRAFRGIHNRATFVAVCLMLLSYGWVVGILLMRVSVMGNDYLYQQRYALLYQFHLIALLLMWVASGQTTLQHLKPFRRVASYWVPAAGCLLLMAVQFPLSANAWRQRPYLWVYYANVASQIEQMAKDPESVSGCPAETVVCGWPLSKRRKLLGLLSGNELNVFSPRVQRSHPYLPRTEALNDSRKGEATTP